MKAFPVSSSDRVWEDGMNLRDYFAAKALQGFLANPKYAEFDHTAVECSYQIADAMMKARAA
jgi:hypothetical protein